MHQINDDSEEYHGNDVSFLVTMRMKQEKRNLEVYLRFLERQRRRSLEMYEYQREQTKLDLEERVKLKSSYLSDLCFTKGKKESIAISRRESLNVLRAHNGRTWNMATGTYHVKSRRLEKRDDKQENERFHDKYYWHIKNDTICRRDFNNNESRKRAQPKTIKTRTRLPFLRRENTDFVIQAPRTSRVNRNGVNIMYSLVC